MASGQLDRVQVMGDSTSVPDWNPGSFELAVAHVRAVRAWSNVHPSALALHNLMFEAVCVRVRLGLSAALSCPSPKDDAEGTYRLTFRFRAPVIERRAESGRWKAVGDQEGVPLMLEDE